MNPVLERKLATIYEYLDCGNFKQALKQINIQLQKNNHVMLRATKALILQRLNRIDECRELLDRIRSEDPRDQHVIDTLVLIYRGLNEQNQATDLYARLFETSPSRETGELLFNSYSGNYNFNEQNNIAMKLYKVTSENKYAIWAIASMYFIAKSDASKLNTLNLALLMLDKVTKTPGFEYTEQILKLEIEMNKLKGNWGKVKERIEAKGDMLEFVDRHEMMGEVYLHTGDEVGAIKEYATVLKANLNTETAQNTWDTYKKYIALNLKPFQEFVPELVQEFETSELFDITGYETDELIRARIAFTSIKRTRVQAQGERNSLKNVQRCSLLSEMEWKKHLLSLNPQESLSKDLLYSLILEYFSTYYDIPSTSEDMRPYLSLLPSDCLEELITSLESEYRTISDSVASLRASCCLHKLKCMCGFYYGLPIQEIEEVVESLLKEYSDALKLENTPQGGEHRIADSLLLVASCVVSRSPRGSTPFFLLLQEITFLEHGLENSPYNFYISLLLIERLKALTGFQEVLRIYNNLKLRSVQHETLGYLTFDFLSDWQIWTEEFSKNCASLDKLHRLGMSELSDSVQQAYQNLNILQVPDFQAFHHKITHSYFYYISFISLMHDHILRAFASADLQECLKVNSSTILQKYDKSWFIDNTDTTVLYDIPVLNEEIEAKYRYGILSDYDIARYYHDILILIYSHFNFNNSVEDAFKEFIRHAEKFQHLWNNLEGIKKSLESELKEQHFIDLRMVLGYNIIVGAFEVLYPQLASQPQNPEVPNKQLETAKSILQFINLLDLKRDYEMLPDSSLKFISQMFIYEALYSLLFISVLKQNLAPKPSKKKPAEVSPAFSLVSDLLQELDLFLSTSRMSLETEIRSFKLPIILTEEIASNRENLIISQQIYDSTAEKLSASKLDLLQGVYSKSLAFSQLREKVLK